MVIPLMVRIDFCRQSRESSATARLAQPTLSEGLPAVAAAMSAATAMFVQRARQAEAGFVRAGDGIIGE